MDDGEIINLLWQRDEAGISGLEQKYFAYCNTIAMNILQNAEDAEECVSDTWLKIWSSIPPNYPKSLKLYAARIIRNLAFNRYRDSHAENVEVISYARHWRNYLSAFRDSFAWMIY